MHTSMRDVGGGPLGQVMPTGTALKVIFDNLVGKFFKKKKDSLSLQMKTQRRFAAVVRAYRFRICNQGQTGTPLLRTEHRTHHRAGPAHLFFFCEETFKKKEDEIVISDKNYCQKNTRASVVMRTLLGATHAQLRAVVKSIHGSLPHRRAMQIECRKTNQYTKREGW